MKTIPALACALVVSAIDVFPALSAAQEHMAAASGQLPARALSASYVTAADARGTFETLSARFTDDEPIKVIDAGSYNVGLFAVGRPNTTGPAQVVAPGSVRVTEGLQLDQVTAIVRILGGTGIFVTGGVLEGAARIAADDPDLPVVGPGNRGKMIHGGDSRRLSVGDTVLIPAGVPHGFSQIDAPMTYLVIRVDAAKALPLK